MRHHRLLGNLEATSQEHDAQWGGFVDHVIGKLGTQQIEKVSGA
jgi:hypothetical protein